MNSCSVSYMFVGRKRAAQLVENPKLALGFGLALLGGFEIPFPGLDVILRHAVAMTVEPAKVELGPGVALLGGVEIPFPRLDVILRNAVAVIVAPAKAVLGLGVTLLAGVLPRYHGRFRKECFLLIGALQSTSFA